MERRFRVRLAELLDDAHVPPTLLRGVLPRLQTFLQPFLDPLQTPQQQTNAHHYVQELLAELAKVPPPTAEELRQLRALIVLERIASPEARQLLEEAAKGPPSARLTHQATAALACLR